MADIFEEFLGIKTEDLQNKSKNSKAKENQNKQDVFSMFISEKDEDTEDVDDYLRQKDFMDIFENASKERKEEFKKVIQHGELQLKETFTKEKIFNNSIRGTVRSKFSDKSITELTNFIRAKNAQIPTPELIDLRIDLTKDIYFEKNTFGKFEYNINAYDTEADEYGETVLNCATNWTTKRIVANWRSEEEFFDHHITKDGWDYYRIKSKNLWDANLLADIEVLYACIFLSAMQEGHEELVSIFKKIKKHPIKLNTRILEQLLRNERKSFWLVHNNSYDIPKLNSVHRTGVGKRNQFSIINKFKLEFIKIRNSSQEIYSIKLGNITPSFRFSAQSDTRFSFLGLPRHILAPKQAESYSLVYGVDTLVLAKANQQSGKLEDVSKGLEYEKVKLETDKIFKENDFEIVDGTISEPLRYNIMDTLATIASFGKLTVESDLSEIYEVLEIPQKTDLYPPIARIISTTTKAKKILLDYISNETGLTQDEILDNFEKERQYFKNYARTYAGAASDCFVAKLLESDIEIHEDDLNINVDQILNSWNTYLSTGEFDDFGKFTKQILYLDFRSQYPHASWLINAMKKFILSAKGIEHQYLNSNKDQIFEEFIMATQKIIDEPYKPFDKDIFKEFDGSADITLHRNLNFRRTNKNRYTEVYILKDSRTTECLIDIAFALIEYSHKHNHAVPIRKLITFNSAERMDLDDVEDYGEELFTKLFLLRKVYEKKYGKHHHIPQTIKIMLNTIYGITAEGTSKDYYGVFLNYTISNPITALSRFFTRYAKLMLELNGALNLNNDTDGLTTKTTLEIAEKIRHIYSETMPLEFESDTSFSGIDVDEDNRINYQLIKKGYFLGKKKYALEYLIIKCGTCDNILDDCKDKENHTDIQFEWKILAKKHAIGQHSGQKDNVDDTFRLMYKRLLEETPIPEIVEEVIPIFKFHSQVTYKKDKDGKIITLKKLLKNGKKIFETTYEPKGIPLSVYYKPTEKFYVCKDCKKRDEVITIDRPSPQGITRKYKVTKCCKTKYDIRTDDEKYLVTNIKNLTKGSFGSFYIHENIYFFIVADIKDDFYKLCEDVINKLQQNELIPYWVKYVKSTHEFWKTTPKYIKNPNINLAIPENELENFQNYYKSYLDLWKILPKVRAKISRLLKFDIDYFSLDIKEEFEKYTTMKPIVMKRKVTEKEMVVMVDTSRKINVDGWNISAYCSLPRMDFSADLLAYQSKYYSQAILMFSFIYSKLYLDKKIKNRDLFNEKVEDLLDKDNKFYPIPKDKTSVIVPFSIKRVFTPEELKNGKVIKDTELMMCLNEKEIESFIKKEAIVHIPEYNQFFIADNELLLKKMENIKKKSFWFGNWMHRKFSFELVSKHRDPASVNATMRIDIRVGGDSRERQIEKFTFKANLRVNPSSREFYNLDLLETSINELNRNGYIIKSLILKALKEYQDPITQEQVLKFFSNRTSTTIQDLQAKEDKYYIHKAQYLVLCFSALKDSLKHLRFKIKTLSITKNIETSLSPEELYTLETYLYRLSDKIKTEYIFSEKNPEIIAKKLRQLKINKHSGSDGHTINNFFRHSALSFYIKNRKQFISKLSRMTLDNYSSLVKIVERSKHIKFKENIFRLELTIFDFNAILEDKYYELFEEAVRFIEDAIKWMVDETIEPKKAQINRFIEKFDKPLKKLLLKWFRIDDLDAEHEKWLNILENG